MTLILELSPEMQTQLEREAAEQDIAPDAYALRLLHDDLQSKAQHDRNQRAIEVLRQMRLEAAAMSDEEAAAAQTEWEEMMRDIDESGMRYRKLFPELARNGQSCVAA